MPALNEGRKNVALLVLLLGVQLLLMSGSARGARGSSVLESWVIRLSSPIVGLADAVGGGLGSVGANVRDLAAAKRRGRILEAEVQRLRAEVERLREAWPENERLRRMLAMRDDLLPDAIAATVVTSNVGGPSSMIVVDRGEAHGVRPYLPVITWGGAVGCVVVAARNHAKVRLLIDHTSGVAAMVQRSRVQGIVVGGSGAALDMIYVPRFSDVMHGDRVVTSGLDGIFPRGFGIGVVTSIAESPDGVQRIRLEPELDFGALEEVLIVLEPAAGEMLEAPPNPVRR